MTMKPTILIVEDNVMNRDVLSRRLEKHGFLIEMASDGQEGINKTNELKPDLIIMDLSLPVINGWEATKIIKDNVETNFIPIIALTAHVTSEDKEKAIAAGCDDYDTKPVNLSRLLSKIDRLIKLNN